MANSPTLFGPNNTAINLQNSMINADGSLHAKNGGVSVAKNYITYGNFENGATTGWSLGTVGTLTNGIPTGSPTFGSGAAGTLSIATVTSGQLAGTTSLSLVSSAATTQGNMLASQAYTIDISDQAKVLTWQFYYSVISGSGNFSGTSSNSFGVAIWDATNSVWLSSTANFAMVQSSGVGVASGTVQTGSSTSSIQLVIYAANATSGAITLYFDQFALSPQVSPIAPTMGDWKAYTPTFSAGFGTVTSINMYSRRVGDSIEIQGSFVTGTAAASAPTMTIGYNGANANVNFDSSKAPVSSICGSITTSTTASTTLFGFTILNPSANGGTALQFGVQNSTTAGSSPLATGVTIGSSVTVEVHAFIPITGWSSNAVSSADTDNRVVAFVGTSASVAVTTTSNTTLTAAVDTHGAWSTNTYNVPVSGVYSVSIVGTPSAVCSLSIWVNGSLYALMSTASSSTFQSCGSILTQQLAAGATIALRTNVNNTATNVIFTITRLSGPAVVQATESVVASYYCSVNFAATTTTPINFDTKEFDSHSAVTPSASAWKFVAPVSGTFQIHTVGNSAAASSGMFLYKNGTVYKFLGNSVAPSSTGFNAGVITLKLNAGDSIDVRPGANTTFTGGSLSGNGVSNISIQRIGN